MTSGVSSLATKVIEGSIIGMLRCWVHRYRTELIAIHLLKCNDSLGEMVTHWCNHGHFESVLVVIQCTNWVEIYKYVWYLSS